MDLNHFLDERLKFAAYFYDAAAKPFENTMLAIENGDVPFVPEYDESGEPPFLCEWIDAKTGLESVGLTALSMIASSLQLFLDQWVSRLEHGDKTFKRTHRKRGWFYAYCKIFEELGLNLDDCPANLELVEQAILARNRGQHPDSITILSTTHSANDLEKYPDPYFASNKDRKLLESGDGEISWWMSPHVYVDRGKLKQASDEMLKLSTWAEEEYWSAVSA
ncbi:TPA: hypothetical protein ACVO0N_004198 [Vibrio diabolicus]